MKKKQLKKNPPMVPLEPTEWTAGSRSLYKSFAVDGKIRGEKTKKRYGRSSILIAQKIKYMLKLQKVAKALTLFSESSAVDLSDILSCL